MTKCICQGFHKPPHCPVHGNSDHFKEYFDDLRAIVTCLKNIGGTISSGKKAMKAICEKTGLSKERVLEILIKEEMISDNEKEDIINKRKVGSQGFDRAMNKGN